MRGHTSAVVVSLLVGWTMNGCTSPSPKTQEIASTDGQARPAVIDRPTGQGYVTLTDADIMALDWQDPASRAEVIARRNVPGPGVEFDIKFPSNQSSDTSISLASTRFGGAGSLAGLDLGRYESFALTITLVAVDGHPTSPKGDALVVGALVYDSANNSRYQPETIDMGQSHGRVKTAVTPIVASARQDGLGFNTHLFVPEKWSSGGCTITLLVQPASGAKPIH